MGHPAHGGRRQRRLVSIEYWRVQVRLSSNSALRTFELRRDPLSEQWLLESIADN